MSIRRRLALWLCPELKPRGWAMLPPDGWGCSFEGVQNAAHQVVVGRDCSGVGMDTKSIVTLAEIYGRHHGYSLSTVSTYAVNDGKRLPHLKNGGGCTVKTATRLMDWFHANWPSDLEWPRNIPRPSKKKEAA